MTSTGDSASSLPVASAETVSDDMTPAAEAASQPVEAAADAIATDAVVDDLDAIAAEAAVDAGVTSPVAATEQAAAAATQPGISEEELNARLDAAREEGRADVRANEQEGVRAQAHQQGYDEGQAAGYAKAKDELGQQYEEKIAQLQAMMNAMQELSYNPDAMFEPMKMLSVHIAEQLVRGELTVSGQAIDRLVKSCLDDLGSHDKAVVVTLNPDDLQRLQALQIDTQSELRLDPDPTLLPGSVRVRAHDAEIQDFIDQRLEALARRLLSDPEAWLKKSSLLHPHEVEPLPDETPKRPWFSRPVDVQDTPSKPVATTEQAEAADAPTERDAAATGAQALDETVPPEDAAPALPAAEALPSPAPDAAAAAQDASDSTPPPAKGHKPPAPKPDPEPSA